LHNNIEKFKNITKNNISAYDFYVIKLILSECVTAEAYLSWETRLKIVEKFEALRYFAFKEWYGIELINFSELLKQFYMYTKAKKPIMNYFNSALEKR